jgi:hypothetical protein
MAELSITPGSLNITAQQGKTWRVELTVTDSDGGLVDLDGYSASWQARLNSNAEDTLFSVTSASGISLGGSAGTITALLSDELTATFPTRTYVHEFELEQPNGEKSPFLAGTLTVTAEFVR